MDRLRSYLRIAATVSCRDCDEIPKVEGAGQVYEEGVEYQVMHNGVRIAKGSYHGEWMTTLIRHLQGHHEPQEEKIFHEAMKDIDPGGVMIEAGSYWAYYSAWFQKSIPGAKNYLIEPNAEKLEAGKRNFALNEFSGKFVRGFVGETGDAAAEFTDWDGSRYQTERICIDDFVQQQGIEVVDLLHADIQGGELNMLRGCRRLIQSGRLGYVFLSTHGDNHEPCLEFFRDVGFHIVAEHTIRESVSGDGLIVARAPGYGSLKNVTISKTNPARSVVGKIGLFCRILTDPVYRELFRMSARVPVE